MEPNHTTAKKLVLYKPFNLLSFLWFLFVRFEDDILLYFFRCSAWKCYLSSFQDITPIDEKKCGKAETMLVTIVIQYICPVKNVIEFPDIF